MVAQSFAITILAISKPRLPGTEYSSSEKFRVEVIFYLRIIALIISNVFLAVVVGSVVVATLTAAQA